MSIKLDSPCVPSIMTMSVTQTEIIFNILRKQNEMLLREISIRENIPMTDLRPFLMPTPRFRTFLRQIAVPNPSSAGSQDDAKPLGPDSPANDRG